MVYALQKFCHYLLRGNLKIFTNHSALKYLFNKPVLGGKICRWFLLFQEYDFEIIVYTSQLNAIPDHPSCIESGEEPTNIDDGFLDAQLFAIKVVDEHLPNIIQFLTTGCTPEEYTIEKKVRRRKKL